MDAVELTRELIKIESTDPGSWETEIGEYICDYLKESGADTETYEVEQGRKIVKGVVKGAKAHPALVFICHMDTVVKGEGWTKNAFGAEVSEKSHCRCLCLDAGAFVYGGDKERTTGG